MGLFNHQSLPRNKLLYDLTLFNVTLEVANEHHAVNLGTALMIASWQVVFTLIQKTHKVPNVLASRIRYHDSTSSNYAVNATVFIFCSADYYHLLDVFLKGILWSVLFTCSVTHQNAQPWGLKMWWMHHRLYRAFCFVFFMFGLCKNYLYLHIY